MSMKVRRQVFLQKLQRVSSLRVVRYSILRTESRPINVVRMPLRHKRSASTPAPMAPDSPQCSWTMISGCFSRRAEAAADEIDFGFYDGEIVLRAALQHEARAERGKVRNAGDVEENVLRAARRRVRPEFPPPASPGAGNSRCPTA